MAGHIADAARLDWCTPKNVLDCVKAAFSGRIDLDPCSNDKSIVPAQTSYILPKNDGLKDPWFGNVFCNPPFGQGETACSPGCTKKRCMSCPLPAEPKCLKGKCRHRGHHITENVPGLRDWVRRMDPANGAGHNACIGLIPAAVDTQHWQHLKSGVFQSASAVCFWKGRIHFEGATAGAPMAIALPYWGPDSKRFCHAFREHGYCIDLWVNDRISKKLTVVVGGERTQIRAAMRETISSVRDRVLEETLNTGRPHHDWLVYDDQGTVLDADAPVSTLSTDLLYASLAVGFGG